MSFPTTKRQEIKIYDRIIKVDTVSDIDELFEALVSKGPDHEDVKDERIPYWADLWPSAVALSNYILKNNLIVPGTKVLEIGCGLGLPGIVAGQLGAKVILSDYIQEALDFAGHNWSLNNSDPADLLLMDWRSPEPSLKVYIVLASDIAYEKKSFDDLIKTFKILLKRGGKMLISEPNRAFAQAFFNGLKDTGFSVNSQKDSLEFRGQKYSIHIHELLLRTH